MADSSTPAITPQPTPTSQSQPEPLSKATAKSTPKFTLKSTSNSTTVPSSFPPKRRGRPPGRPNTTVKESNYDSNPTVQHWNSLKLEPAIAAVAINIRDALQDSMLTRGPQRAIFKLPSREIIYFVQGWITSRQIASQRPSYVNGLLIHSRGEDSPQSCTQCVEKRGKNALGPFLVCRVLPGKFHDSCSNCKWFDTTSSCSLYTGPKPNRKRKPKDVEEGKAALDGGEGVSANGTSALSSGAQEQGELIADGTLTGLPAEDTEMAVLALHRENGNVEDANEDGTGTPSEHAQET